MVAFRLQRCLSCDEANKSGCSHGYMPVGCWRWISAGVNTGHERQNSGGELDSTGIGRGLVRVVDVGLATLNIPNGHFKCQQLRTGGLGVAKGYY
jgi:hypothetical protein